MKTTALVARILLGLVFVVMGLNGFLHYIPGGPPPGPATTFTEVLVTSHYAIFVFGVQVVVGVLLLTNQFVPLALFVLAPVLANILVFHITMLPAGLPLALIVTALWIFVALQCRAIFVPLFVQHAKPDASDRGFAPG